MYDELTQVDIDKMKAELEDRRLNIRPKIMEDVKTARAFGDLSENYEYKAAKDAQRRKDSRMRYLEKMNATAKVVVSVEVDEDLRRDLAYYDVTRLELNNVCFTGTLSYTDGDHYAWSGQGGKKAVYNIDRSTAYLLLPQPLGDDVTLTLDYSMTFNTDGTVYTYDSDGQPVATDHYTYSRTGATARPNTMVSRLTGDPVDEWLPNHVYHYHVVLRTDRIDFTAEVAPWGDYNWTILN